MKMNSYGITVPGRVRDHNEDAYLIEDNLFIVADGMGGHAAGDVASEIAVEAVFDFVDSMDKEATWPFPTDSDLSFEANKLATAIKMGNQKVIETVKENSEYAGMGTTLVSMYITDQTGVVGHVGDSRAYRIRDGDIEKITTDHSWVNDQIRAGAMDPGRANNHPLKNVITRALGSDEEVQVDIAEFPLKDDDLYLLCSDGLNSMLEDREILKAIEERNDLESACNNLIDKANEKGGEDNITAILIHLEE